MIGGGLVAKNDRPFFLTPTVHCCTLSAISVRIYRAHDIFDSAQSTYNCWKIAKYVLFPIAVDSIIPYMQEHNVNQRLPACDKIEL